MKLTAETMLINWMENEMSFFHGARQKGIAEGWQIREAFSSTANAKSHKGWDITALVKPMIERGELFFTKKHAKQITYYTPRAWMMYQFELQLAEETKDMSKEDQVQYYIDQYRELSKKMSAA